MLSGPAPPGTRSTGQVQKVRFKRSTPTVITCAGSPSLVSISDIKMGDLYQETSSTTFPTSSFSWREIAVAGLPGWRGAPPASGAPDTSRNSSAGGFHYSGSALVSSSLCRNRFILW